MTRKIPLMFREHQHVYIKCKKRRKKNDKKNTLHMPWLFFPFTDQTIYMWA